MLGGLLASQVFRAEVPAALRLLFMRGGWVGVILASLQSLLKLRVLDNMLNCVDVLF